jgi:hypothetical protein
VISASSNVLHLAAGHDQSCAVIVDNTTFVDLLRCWGNNASGQLGIPTTTASSGPTVPRWGD